MTDKKPLAVFRIVAREFAELDDATVEGWIEFTEPMVSRKQFRKLWTQALALLTAHRMKLAGYGSEPDGEDALSEISNLSIGSLMRITNVSEGDTSVGFNTSPQFTDSESEYGLTMYGIQYLRLRRMCIVPIQIS